MMSKLSRWSFPTQVVFGSGAVACCGEALQARGVKQALIVTDAGVRKAGLVEPVVVALRKAGIATAVFDGVEGNPLQRHSDAALAAYRDAGAQGLVAVGGGSAMDVAKVVALQANHSRPLADYDDAVGGGALVTGSVPAVVAIPTTAGTGSEVGRSAVVTLASSGRKTVFFSPKLLPIAAILDPVMTRGLPPHLTAATGYDALTHCLEALVAKGDHPLADGIALEGIVLVARSLRRAVSCGDDLRARGDMLKAAMMGAVAFQKGLGVCHSLAHPLSSVSGLHHGLANALCLPAAVLFNSTDAAASRRYRQVADILGSKDASANECSAALAQLREDVGLPARLSQVGVTEEQIEPLTDAALADGCHASNPRTCSHDDLKRLYRAVF